MSPNPIEGTEEIPANFWDGSSPHNCEVGELRGGEVQRHREPVGQRL